MCAIFRESSTGEEELRKGFLDDTEMALARKLDIYSHSDYIPFHMPGHKRQADDPDLVASIPWQIDITEIEGFDNLHHAEGILKKSMDLATGFYGVKKSIYCINGSTGGILSAIFTVTNPGDTILIARNSHKSAYHGVFLRGLKPLYVYPKIDKDTGIGCGYQPEIIRDMLINHSEIKAIFITSPTYEGIVSDIKRIAEIAHERGIPLIVDEAHGAHLTMKRHLDIDSGFPVSAVCLGADIVIQSLHKTLPALTQAAIVHVNGSLVNPDRVQMYLSMFQTSSPSYVLMASIDSCMRFLDSEQGDKRRACYGQRLQVFREEIRKRRGFHLLERFPLESWTESMDKDHCGDSVGKHWKMDPSKLPIACDYMDGRQLYDYLLDQYHIQCEMCTGQYVLLMTSMFDTEEMYERFLYALDDINRRYQSGEIGELFRDSENRYTGGKKLPRPVQVYIPLVADQMSKEAVLLKDSIGRVSAEYAYQYPPGIPLLVPGERIDEEVLKRLLSEYGKGLKIEGLQDIRGEWIQVLREQNDKRMEKENKDKSEDTKIIQE